MRKTSLAVGTIFGIVFWLTAVGLEAVQLKTETTQAWQLYVEATEHRIQRELRSGHRFLAMDWQQPATAAEERRAVLDGEIRTTKMRSLDPRGSEVAIPSGTVHHWRGAVFIPGVRLEEVMERVTDPGDDDTEQADVLESAVLARGPDSLHLYLKLQRKKVVTVVYNSEHVIRFQRHGATRASSSSVATRIVELENPDSPTEREKPPGRDRGFLWRLNSYWRYEQVEGGVIVECESLSLSRAIPLEMFRPIVDSVARESMQRTLEGMRERHRRQPKSRVDRGCRKSLKAFRKAHAGVLPSA
jgi:hypothetical protein